MNNVVSTSRPASQKMKPYSLVSQKLPNQLWIAVILGVLLLAAPRTRVVFVAPIYFIDILAFLLIILPVQGKLNRWVPKIPISKLVPVYLGTMLISELRGLFEYGVVMEPVYMMVRYLIAVSLFFTIPRLVSRPEHVTHILKGMVLGTLLSAIVVILYSLGPTRSLVVSFLFSNGFLNPGWQRLLELITIFGANEAAMRGRSLVGSATMTAGFLSVTWPIAFITYHKFKQSFFWKRVALATIILAPIAVLMTYGRGAWIMVGVVLFLIAIFGLAGGRKILLMVLVVGSIVVTQIEIDTDLFFFDRIFGQAKVTLDDPLSDVSTTERLLSYVEPFGHLWNNPSWLLAGAGGSGSKLQSRGDLKVQLYDEIGLATHSAFSKSYYSFGVVAAVCQVLFVILGFRFIIVRVLRTPAADKDQKIIWQSLLMSWSTYSLWWASGHAMVGAPRGVMLSFLLLGLLLAFEKIRLIEIAEKHDRAPLKPC